MTATPYYLSELVPQTGLLADYPLADAETVATNVITDFSGNSRTLTAPLSAAYAFDQLNGYPAMVFDGTTSFPWTGALLVKHAFVLPIYDLAANFGGTYRGLLTGVSSGDILVGDNGASSTKFTNFAFGGTFAYKKSQVAYVESNQQAPFSNFELLEVSSSGGFSLDGIRLGQQKTDTTRRWRGRLADTKLYSIVLSAAQLASLRLYYDLKYHLWLLNGTTLFFPSFNITGIRYVRFKQLSTDWNAVTDSWEYEDAGRDFNDRTDTPPTEWEIGFNYLTKAQLDIFEAFNSAARRSRTFSFTDKLGVTHTGVRIKSYESNHDTYKSWDRKHWANFRLCKYS